MYKICFSLLTALLAFGPVCKAAFENPKDQDGKIEAVVAPLKMNVLYIGFDNPLDIAVPGVASKDVSASMNGNGSIQKISDGHFVARPTQVGKCIIMVAVRGKEVSGSEFRVKRIPDPVVTLGGKLMGGESRKESLIAQSGIVALMRGIDIDMRFPISSFSMAISSKGGSQVQELLTTGPFFTPAMKAMIGQAKPGDKIFIDNVIVTGPDSQTRRLGPLVFTIL